MSWVFKNREELERFMIDEVVNTAGVMELLNCSRQNVFDLIRRGKLKPIKETPKERLFLKSDILERIKPSE
ncbi:hypothetical protein Ga0466249_005041 [Sporomusaceae bacterium BoRhaA]|uniref:helix-turn-helix transcriptional regulator n=1 Tax=Pelorhabdus rhamnosifermentans TaxID=2772457 RepID=UPI001C060468|nr:helix-turn-helix domain-containing protein [Pelorhabdus rhamnosifermentans]MBU2703891.1 hypothetical protein [Pelorhabdus rhamnosifermentans]